MPSRPNEPVAHERGFDGTHPAGEGIGDVVVSRGRVDGHELAAELTVFAPVCRDGREPPIEPSVLAVHLRHEVVRAADSSDPVRFRAEADEVCARVAIPADASCYGTGEVPGPLERTGRTTTLWNTDAWGWDETTPALYQSHPYVLVVHADGSAEGWLAQSFRRGQIEVAEESVEFRFEGEPFDLVRIAGSSPQEVQSALAILAGPMGLPPLWALGYHQCRWGYDSAQRLLRIARRLRAERVPCDGIWIDIDHMDRHRVFTWDAERFPDPTGLIDALRAMDFRVVAILDPGIAVTKEPYEALESGLDEGHFVLDADLAPARGVVWPGVCHFPDFTRSETRAWWSERVARHVHASGLDGLWVDMNEPALFKTSTQTLPDDVHHEGFGGGTHRRFHNLYGMLMTEATRDGLARARPSRRPFVLTRANHLAGSRFAATWVGDNRSRWEDLRQTIAVILNLGLSGQPFSGADLPGFHGDPTPELFVRWFELGALLPFCRGHSDKPTADKEPWVHGESPLVHVRAVLERRMRLLPYLYTAFHEAATRGTPVARPLFWANVEDSSLRAIDDAFLLGSDLLVAPVLEEGVTERRVVLPRTRGGGWYRWTDVDDGALAEPLEPGEHSVAAPLGRTPIFVRAGALVPTREPGLTVADAGALELLAYLDAAGEARGRLYDDAGDGPLASGAFAELGLTLRRRDDGDRLDVERLSGERPFDHEPRVFVRGAVSTPG